MADNGIAKKKSIQNPLLQENFDNLNRFVEYLNCLSETFDFNEVMLSLQLKRMQKKWEDFIAMNGGPDIEGKIVVPDIKQREFKTLSRKLNRAKQALVLVPPSYLVSLVSLFDSFYAGLVRNIYNLSPQKLQESKMTFLYRDLQNLDSIKEVKRIIVDKKIEDLLRASHIEQFKWLAEAMGVKTLTKFDEWKDFIEITERRNLFVHSNGIVSSQYIKVCKQQSDIESHVQVGIQLTVDSPYFSKACEVFCKTAVMLSQMLARTLYIKNEANDIQEIDKNLIGIVFDLIVEKKYKMAISISKFALNDKFKHFDNDKFFIILNLAQALKWDGQVEECMKLLNEQDCTAWKIELLIPKYALVGAFEEAYEKMIELGNKNKVLTAAAYREWPIFQEIRKEDKFSITFTEIFGEELGIQQKVTIASNEEKENLSIVIA